MLELRYVIDMAEIPTFLEIQETGMVPEASHPSVRGYLDRQTAVLQEGLRVEVNGQRLSLHPWITAEPSRDPRYSCPAVLRSAP